MEEVQTQPGQAPVPPISTAGATGTATPTPAPSSTAAAPVEAPKTVAATPEDVAARLGAQPEKQEVAPVASAIPVIAEPVATEPTPFDLTQLTPDQLITLRAMLDGAPMRQIKKGNPVVKMRRLDGRIILDFKNCFQALHKDELTQITSELVMIPVNFMGADGHPEVELVESVAQKKWVNVEYKTFMNADQIKCEVVSSRQMEGSFSEGEVESNERPGVMVELEVKTVKDFFTVKLPEGSPVPQVEIEGKVANA